MNKKMPEPIIDDHQRDFQREDMSEMDETNNAIKRVIESLFEHADIERKKSESYKNMFHASEFGLRGAIEEAKDKMIDVVLDLCSVIEQRTGKTVDNDLYYMIMGLPLFAEILERHISDTEGFVCCVDKAREIAKNYALSRIR
jgi:hypothetical protein